MTKAEGRIRRFVFALLVGCLPGMAAAQTITLRYASPYPPSHPFSRADIAWMKHVEAASGGRLRIKPFWGGTLVSADTATLELEHGVADISMITPIYSLAGMQNIKMQASFYSGADTPAQQIAVYACLQRRFPVLDAELGKLRVLAVQGGSQLHVLTRTHLVPDLAALHGLRLRVPTELVPVMRELGADPMTMPMDQVYSSLSKGIIDGVIAPGDTLLTLHFVEVAPHYSEISIPRGAYPARAISARAWNRLPPDLQKIMADLEGFWEAQLDNTVTQAEQAGIAFGHQQGEIFTPISSAEQTRFYDLYDAAALQQAQDVGGAQGVAMFHAAHQAIAAMRAGKPAC